MKQSFKFFTLLSTSMTIIIGCGNSTGSQGQIEHILNSNIVGGEKLEEMTDIRSSTVLVLFAGGTHSAAVCTGTLIASDIVLTAAHCTPSKERGSALIGFGNNIEESFGKAKYPPVAVIDAKTDPLYDESDLGKNSVHDIALLKLSAGVPESFKIRNLPEKNFVVASSDELEMIGFGRTSEDQADAGILHHTSIAASQITSTIYDGETKMDYALPGNIAVLQPTNGVCNGDSGSPLFVKSADGKVTLIGVTSKSGNIQNDAMRCHGYSLFVDVRSQLKWITATVVGFRK
jgi:secreted trypsin-like serine protease